MSQELAIHRGSGFLHVRPGSAMGLHFCSGNHMFFTWFKPYDGGFNHQSCKIFLGKLLNAQDAYNRLQHVLTFGCKLRAPTGKAAGFGRQFSGWKP